MKRPEAFSSGMVDRGFSRREFCLAGTGAALGLALVPGCLSVGSGAVSAEPGVRLEPLLAGEDLFAYIARVSGGFSRDLYRQIVGAANEFKEGDRIVGVAAADSLSRDRARELLRRTNVGRLAAVPLFDDPLYDAINAGLDPAARERLAAMTLGELRGAILDRPAADLLPLLEGLPSDIAACLVKIMDNADLVAAGRKIHHPLPGSQIGAPGYLGARIQPNSPTDNPEDILWQVLCGFSYAVGDVVLGTNPVGSEPESVAAVERCLLEVRRAFGLEAVVPHSVLAHVDIQARVEKEHPGTTGIWFQSLAGSTAVNNVFDLSLDKMLAHADQRTGQYGFYFETGQGADFTNGHAQGTDMVVHEARKYGFARLLRQRVATAQRRAGKAPAPWVHVNDVAGFIGPEVFRTRDQLVRCCLEDIVMAKLQGVTIGLDVCSTLHMDVSLDDLDWCLDQVMPCQPAYLMALPTKMDPMLGYLTTGFQDHVRLRQKFGTRVNDAMWQFFQRLQVVDAAGNPGPAFGQPLQVWLAYGRARGDQRPEAEILAEGRRQMQAVRKRGVPLAEGCGTHPWDLEPALDREIRAVYTDAKKCIWAAVPETFVRQIPDARRLVTASKDRTDYILHPQTGEVLDDPSQAALLKFRRGQARPWPVQLVVSDGLNAYSITDDGNLLPYLQALRAELERAGLPAAPEILVLRNGRVRAGYRIGETLFRESASPETHRAIVHVIGERPGSMHHTFSAYLTAPSLRAWNRAGTIDHNITRVVSGIAADALPPAEAAAATARIVKEQFAQDL